jgi:UDPglucose 6-dehydrogenase
MNICVIGTGYVGLVAGTCFAESGNDVICVDIDQDKIDKLKHGVIPIFEPELEDLVVRNAKEGRLIFSTDVIGSIKASRIVFIAVGTPQDEDGSADLQHVLDAAKTIGQSIEHHTIIVDKSTVPVGTADKVREMVRSVTDIPFDVVSNPEFMKEGAAVTDFLKPDRVVIGTDSKKVAEIMSELYAPFVRTENPIMIMDIRSAELTKYASNALLATKISFMNEIARLAEKVGADVAAVRRGAGADKRIGYQFLFPGVGYGGSCFPKDVKALIHTAQESGMEMQVIQAVDRVNEEQKKKLIEKVVARFGNDLSGMTFAVWGLSFKPQTDDMREAPSVVTINGLLERGAKVMAHDPEAMEVAKGVFGDRIGFCESNYDACEGADALIVVTEWNEFRRPNYDRIKGLLKNPVIFDGRNIYTPEKMLELGFEYYCIGRPPVTAEGWSGGKPKEGSTPCRES